jgi:hypothetical protein
MPTPEDRLTNAIRRLKAHRAAVAAKGYKTPQDNATERKLLRAYRRQVENGCWHAPPRTDARYALCPLFRLDRNRRIDYTGRRTMRIAMTTRTPGKWVFTVTRHPDGSFSGRPYIYAPNARIQGGLHIAELCKVGEAEANGRLMAEAPNLLDACHKTLYALRKRTDSEKTQWERDLVGIVRDAIEKAEGRW